MNPEDYDPEDEKPGDEGDSDIWTFDDIDEEDFYLK